MYFLAKKMYFIDFEATKEFKQLDEKLNFSGDENNNDEVADMFINDNKEIINKLSFYRQYANQRRNPEETILDGSDDESFLDVRDFQPELYNIEDRDKVTFGKLCGYDKKNLRNH